MPTEANLLSLGAKGHFENPITDLLRFFLDPHEIHGLGGWFLQSLCGCLEQSTLGSLPERIVLVTRSQEWTDSGKFIDIVVEATSWVIAIEHKNWARLANPFDE